MTNLAGRITIVLNREDVDVLPVSLVLGDVRVRSRRRGWERLLVLGLETQATPAGCGPLMGSLMRCAFGASLLMCLAVACYSPSYLVDNRLAPHLRGDLRCELKVLVCASIELLESTMFKLTLRIRYMLAIFPPIHARNLYRLRVVIVSGPERSNGLRIVAQVVVLGCVEIECLSLGGDGHCRRG